MSIAASPNGAAVPDVAAGRARLDAIDAGIRDLIEERIELSRQVQQLRRTQGRPGVQHCRENQIVAGYVEALGDPGTDIALAVLTLCRGRLG